MPAEQWAASVHVGGLGLLKQRSMGFACCGLDQLPEAPGVISAQRVCQPTGSLVALQREENSGSQEVKSVSEIEWGSMMGVQKLARCGS
jgi:hypothetical protein